MIVNVNEVLALDKKSQEHWIGEQQWYGSVYSQAESADPFVLIFDNIPTIWNKSFIEELALDGEISEDRFSKIEAGWLLTDSETDVIRQELARRYFDQIWFSEARMGYFELGSEGLIAVFVGQAERREQWDPVFIGLYASVADAKKAIYSAYSKVYVSERFLEGDLNSPFDGEVLTHSG